MSGVDDILTYKRDSKEDLYALLNCSETSTEAKEILCDPEKRASYDKWRNSGIQISYKNWLGMKEHVQQSMHWAIPKTKDRMLPEGGATGGTGSGTGSGL
uniref:J domain-containing protein n=1 Tax=Anopheles culicifacies TaxID=139723 RepID=A0A182M4C2_9DIPT